MALPSALPPQPATPVAVASSADWRPATADEVVVQYNPVPAAERVAHYSGLVRTRIIWLGVGALICLGIWALQREQLDRGSTLALFGVGVGYSFVWLAMGLVGFVRARRVLHSIGQGVALRIARWGIDIHGATVPWGAVRAVRAHRRPLSAFGPDLIVEAATGERRSLPWLYLDTLPGTVDAAVQAYTGGARSLDVSKLDH
ncbi:MAG: hypothetical protein LBS56_04900 [Propionibacteriaceae bacterium]|nr:hypothetical protein [Propionibacteriaceae bacterium]